MNGTLDLSATSKGRLKYSLDFTLEDANELVDNFSPKLDLSHSGAEVPGKNSESARPGLEEPSRLGVSSPVAESDFEDSGLGTDQMAGLMDDVEISSSSGSDHEANEPVHQHTRGEARDTGAKMASISGILDSQVAEESDEEAEKTASDSLRFSDDESALPDEAEREYMSLDADDGLGAAGFIHTAAGSSGMAISDPADGAGSDPLEREIARMRQRALLDAFKLDQVELSRFRAQLSEQYHVARAHLRRVRLEHREGLARAAAAAARRPRPDEQAAAAPFAGADAGAGSSEAMRRAREEVAALSRAEKAQRREEVPGAKSTAHGAKIDTLGAKDAGIGAKSAAPPAVFAFPSTSGRDVHKVELTESEMHKAGDLLKAQTEAAEKPPPGGTDQSGQAAAKDKNAGKDESAGEEEEVVSRLTAMQEARAISKTMQKLKLLANAFAGNPQLAGSRIQLKKAVSTPINQISAKREQVVSRTALLDTALSEARSASAEAYAFALDLAAFRLVAQAHTQICIHTGSSFPYADVIAALCRSHADLAAAFQVRLFKACPYVIPQPATFYHRKKGMSDTDYLKRIGYRNAPGNQGLETTEQYKERMLGSVALLAAVYQSPVPGNPINISRGWVWLARFLNIPPIIISADVVHTFLTVAGTRLQQSYPRQFAKIVRFVETDYLKRLPEKALQGRERLKILLGEYHAQQNVWPAADGMDYMHA